MSDVDSPGGHMELTPSSCLTGMGDCPLASLVTSDLRLTWPREDLTGSCVTEAELGVVGA